METEERDYMRELTEKRKQIEKLNEEVRELEKLISGDKWREKRIDKICEKYVGKVIMEKISGLMQITCMAVEDIEIRKDEEGVLFIGNEIAFYGNNMSSLFKKYTRHFSYSQFDKEYNLIDWSIITDEEWNDKVECFNVMLDRIKRDGG